MGGGDVVVWAGREGKAWRKAQAFRAELRKARPALLAGASPPGPPRAPGQPGAWARDAGGPYGAGWPRWAKESGSPGARGPAHMAGAPPPPERSLVPAAPAAPPGAGAASADFVQVPPPPLPCGWTCGRAPWAPGGSGPWRSLGGGGAKGGAERGGAGQSGAGGAGQRFRRF